MMHAPRQLPTLADAPLAPPASRAGTEVRPGPADPHAGQVLDGRYVLDTRIGEGQTGWIYRARHEATGRLVAVKLLREPLLDDEASRRRFCREARAACRINHPNAITTFDFGCAKDGPCYLVTELLQGQTLRCFLRESPLLPPDAALSLFLQLASGMAAAHSQGVVHRDLHPGNIFVCKESGPARLKVFDFGGAVVMDTEGNAEVTQGEGPSFGQLLSSIRYLPPERLNRKSRPDPRGDVYALGLILFELCTGHLPFESSDPLQVMAMHLRDAVPLLSLAVRGRWFSPALQGLVDSMLAKDPAQRPAHAGEVLARLSELVEWGDLIAEAPPQAGRTRRDGPCVQRQALQEADEVEHLPTQPIPLLPLDADEDEEGSPGGDTLINTVPAPQAVVLAVRPEASYPSYLADDEASGGPVIGAGLLRSRDKARSKGAFMLAALACLLCITGLTCALRGGLRSAHHPLLHSAAQARTDLPWVGGLATSFVHSHAQAGGQRAPR